MLTRQWGLGVSAVFLLSVVLLYMAPGIVAKSKISAATCFVGYASVPEKQRLTDAAACISKHPQHQASKECARASEHMIMSNPEYRGAASVKATLFDESSTNSKSPLESLKNLASKVLLSGSQTEYESRKGVVVRTGVRAAPIGAEEAKNRSPNKVSVHFQLEMFQAQQYTAEQLVRSMVFKQFVLVHSTAYSRRQQRGSACSASNPCNQVSISFFCG
jgi:hypothetical protein